MIAENLVPEHKLKTPLEGDAGIIQNTEEWKYIEGSSDLISGPIKEPQKNLYLQRPVSGDVEAKIVKLDSVEVNGMLTASEAVIILGGVVRQDVNSKSVQLTSENNQTSIVYGEIKGKNIKIGKGSLVYGDVGTTDSRVDTAGKLQGNLTGTQIILRQNAIVHSDVYTTADSIIMEPGAEVRGRFIGLNKGTIKIIKGEPEDGEWARQDENGSPNIRNLDGPQNFDNNRDVLP